MKKKGETTREKAARLKSRSLLYSSTGTAHQEEASMANGHHEGQNAGCFDFRKMLSDCRSKWIKHKSKVRNKDKSGSEPETTADLESRGENEAVPKHCILKFIFFTVFGTVGVLASYLPLYLKEMGFSPGQIGTILFFRPVGGFLGGVISPLITEKFPTQEKAMMCFAGIFLASSFTMGLMTPLSLSNTCLDETILNSSDDTNDTLSVWGFPKPSDRSWMFHTDKLAVLLTCFSILVFSGEFFFVSVDTVLHGITMKRLGKGNSQSYGLIRCWGAVGHGVGSALAGVMISWTVREQRICGQMFKFADYHFMFYIFSGFAYLTFLNAASTFEDSATEKKSIAMSGTEFRSALYTLKNVAWLFVVLCRSIFYAVTQGFLYWHMENIGASPTLIGLANLVTTSTEFAMFFATPKLIVYFGHMKLVSVGIFSYVFRFLIFSFITNPLFILPMEILEGVTFACVWSSIISYFSNQVPDGGQTHVQGVIQAVFMLGTSVGFLLSGALTQQLGASGMFRVFAGIAAVVLVLFVLAQYTNSEKTKEKK